MAAIGLCFSQMTLGQYLLLIAVSFIIIPGIAGFAMCAYFAHTQLEDVLLLMRKAGGRFRTHADTGLHGQMLLMGEIASLVFFSDYMVLKGAASRAEIAAIPETFKRRLIIIYTLLSISLAGIIIVWLLIQLYEATNT